MDGGDADLNVAAVDGVVEDRPPTRTWRFPNESWNRTQRRKAFSDSVIELLLLDEQQQNRSGVVGVQVAEQLRIESAHYCAVIFGDLRLADEHFSGPSPASRVLA
ncbi:hypothetical protein OG874_02695 [Nocardia sp. NBC_00565]|uniref:hypothetical protein n=1 Tax=Nocardia sp. NBC_00565 TaxID=2975993 RepID=UPI002E817890|nr:hypothetical protein [Nocardia sp. NBC_00565]WUC04143.1 hypothetical protein OG874_02695 [Nocardia sp. NBC_00565]